MNNRDISVRMDFVRCTTRLDQIEMVCVASDKHKTVELCIAANMHIPFAQIKLYASGLYKDAEATFADAAALGEAIAQAWNAGRSHLFGTHPAEPKAIACEWYGDDGQVGF